MQIVIFMVSLPESLDSQPSPVKIREKKPILDDLKNEQEALKVAYAAADNDPDRKAVVDDWASLD